MATMSARAVARVGFESAPPTRGGQGQRSVEGRLIIDHDRLEFIPEAPADTLGFLIGPACSPLRHDGRSVVARRAWLLPPWLNSSVTLNRNGDSATVLLSGGQRRRVVRDLREAGFDVTQTRRAASLFPAPHH